MAATPIPAVSGSNTRSVPADLTTGAVPDVTNGNSTPNNGRTFLLIQNTAATPDTVVVTRTEVVDGAALPTQSLTVAANKTMLFGPFPTQLFSASLQYKAGLVTTKFIPLAF